MHIDVFNGDADGIFSLIQLRKVNPIAAEKQRLVTGVKRDISLVRKISDTEASQANITVLDISFDKNERELARVLTQAESVFYCDHHQANALFEDKRLTTVINTDPAVCTALLINDYLQNAQVLWAVAAAYGDGLDGSAERLADELKLTMAHKASLKELGMLVNYNGYGNTEADLYYPPAELYKNLMTYDNPFAVTADAASPYAQLKAGYDADLANAQAIPVQAEAKAVLVVELPNAPWANRISGTYGNILAAQNRDKAIVIVSNNSHDSLTISLRAPKNNPYGAADICSQFATGGGREGAAGINALETAELSQFVELVSKTYSNER
jgi:hypothetical protein